MACAFVTAAVAPIVVQVGETHRIMVLDPIAFKKFESGSACRTSVGTYILMGKCKEDGRVLLAFAPRFATVIEQIDRDDAWKRRLELARMIGVEFRGIELEKSFLQHELPLSLLTPLYLAACRNVISTEEVTSQQVDLMPGVAGTHRNLLVAEDIMSAFNSNSQQRFQAVVESYMLGRTRYNIEPYCLHGPAREEYSHIEHLSHVYTRQFEFIFKLLKQQPSRRITIVDLGTGGGHFLLTLSDLLIRRNWIDRVRLVGIDKSERDMKHARRLAQQRDIRIAFQIDDLADAGFPDRLRRLQPDVVVANHIIEHLGGEPENRYLQDWLLAARHSLMVSVPLQDDPAQSISSHTDAFDSQRVAKLAKNMELRTGRAVAGEDIDELSKAGVIVWTKAAAVVANGGLGENASILHPNEAHFRYDPILKDFATPFDPREFSKVRRAALIGTVQDRETFEAKGFEPRQVRQLLIKVPHSAAIIPPEFQQAKEAIQLILDHNRASNPSYHSSFAYLNIFRGETNFSSYRGLSLSCHGDQLQTLQEGYAFSPDWSYIVSNTLPTMFFEQSFDVSDAVARARRGESVNLYDYFNKQADESTVYHSQDFGIYLLSPYVVHSASEAKEGVWRVFLKIAFSTKRFFDNRELRRNPAFSVDEWYLQDTVGYIGGFFSHAHWNERFLKCDIQIAR